MEQPSAWPIRQRLDTQKARKAAVDWALRPLSPLLGSRLLLPLLLLLLLLLRGLLLLWLPRLQVLKRWVGGGHCPTRPTLLLLPLLLLL